MTLSKKARPVLTLGAMAIALTGCLTDSVPGSVGASSLSASSGAVAMEDFALTLINAQRKKGGIPPLLMRDDLRRVARAHSVDMAARDFHDHTNPDGESPWDRMSAAGIAFSSSAENIAWNNHKNQAEVAVDAWMKSSGHRGNILNAEFTHTGMGIAMDGDDGAYFTQVFTRD